MTDRRGLPPIGGDRGKAMERRSMEIQNRIDRAIWDAVKEAKLAYPCDIPRVSKECIAKVKALMEEADRR